MKSVIIFMMLCTVVFGEHPVTYNLACDVEVFTEGQHGIECVSALCADEKAECQAMANKLGVAWKTDGSWDDDASGCLHYTDHHGIWYNKVIHTENPKPCTSTERCVNPSDKIENDGVCQCGSDEIDVDGTCTAVSSLSCSQLKTAYDAGSELCSDLKQKYKSDNCCS